MFRKQLPALVTVLPLFSWCASATSIVAQIGPNRILFAADTHGDKLNPNSKSSNENECKIVPLSHAAFAITGNMDYTRHQPDDPVTSWDSRADGREAYSLKGGDLVGTAAEWSRRAKEHFLSFYRATPRRVAQLAKANDQNILLIGLFVGFHDNQAKLVFQMVFLDEHQATSIREKQVLLPAQEASYVRQWNHGRTHRGTFR